MAIIHKHQRPAIRIRDDSFESMRGPWLELEKDRTVIEHAVRSVGRLESSDDWTPFLGTAFLVAHGVAMTTRHVVETFSNGIGDGKIELDPNRTVWLNFRAEEEADLVERAKVTEVVFIHPYWDVAAVRVDTDRSFLKLEAFRPEENSIAAVIGYPARDMRSERSVQDQIFEGIYNVKRILPGRICGEKKWNSFGNSVTAMTHDASTLGGTSGAPVIDTKTGRVVGVTFAGQYLLANYAVPADELMKDSRVRHHLNMHEPVWMPLWDAPQEQKSESSLAIGTGSDFSVKSFSYLPHSQLLQLCELLIQSFPDDKQISTLFVGIPPEFLAALPDGANAKEKLLRRLVEINKIGRGVVDEHSPLFVILQNACYLRKMFPEHPSLMKLLQKVESQEVSTQE